MYAITVSHTSRIRSHMGVLISRVNVLRPILLFFRGLKQETLKEGRRVSTSIVQLTIGEALTVRIE